LINTNTGIAFANPRGCHQLLMGVCQRLGAADGFDWSPGREPPPEDGFTKYHDLDHDHPTRFTTPFATCRLS
jgi:hypothetical protein